MSIAVEGGGTAAPARPGTAGLVFNFVAFQVGWFACVLGAAHGYARIGTTVAATIVAAHIARAPRPGREAKLIACAIAIGAAYDSALVSLGWVAYPLGTIVEGAAPHWILALWALFAMTLNVSLRWLHGRYALASLLGAVCGPLSYWGGVKLGALVLTRPVPALLALCIGWAILMPALTAIARRFDRARVPHA